MFLDLYIAANVFLYFISATILTDFNNRFLFEKAFTPDYQEPSIKNQEPRLHKVNMSFTPIFRPQTSYLR